MESATTNKVSAGIALGLCLFALQPFALSLEFSREPVWAGEIWRLWTGHLVHTDVFHLLLNLSPALIIYFAFFPTIRGVELLLCASLFCPLISVALLMFYPAIDWYNGLSGLLHALVAYFSIRLACTQSRIYWAALVLVWTKILVETLAAQSGYVSFIGDMRVINEAHFIGALIGTSAGVAANSSVLFHAAKVRP